MNRENKKYPLEFQSAYNPEEWITEEEFDALSTPHDFMIDHKTD
jgi:hypothetical protein